MQVRQPGSRTAGRRGRHPFPSTILVLALLATLFVAPPARADDTSTPGYDWTEFGGGPDHSGNNTQETALGPENVAGLEQLFRVALPAVADGAPAYLRAVPTPDGPRD